MNNTNSIDKVGKHYFIIRIVVLLAVLICAAYLMAGRHIFIGGEITFVGNIILGSFVVILFITFVLFEHIKGVNKVNVIALGMICVLFICMLVVMLTTPKNYTLTLIGYGNHEISADIEITTQYKVCSLFNFSSILIAGYLLIFSLPLSLARNREIIVFIVLAFSAIMLVLCILTFFLEWDNYVLFIKNLNNGPENYAIKSLFPHRNNWGFALLIAIWASLLAVVFMKKYWLIPLPFIFYGFMVFSLCKTTLIIGLLLILATVIYYLVNSYKAHKKRNLILIGVGIGLFVIGLLVVFLTPLRESFLSVFKNRGHDSLEARRVIWYKVFQMNNNLLKVLFGTGYGVLSKNLYAINYADIYFSGNWGTFKAHNMYIQVYGDGGVIMLLVFLAAIGYVFYKLIKNYRSNHYLNYAYILGLISLLSMWFFES